MKVPLNKLEAERIRSLQILLNKTYSAKSNSLFHVKDMPRGIHKMNVYEKFLKPFVKFYSFTIIPTHDYIIEFVFRIPNYIEVDPNETLFFFEEKSIDILFTDLDISHFSIDLAYSKKRRANVLLVNYRMSKGSLAAIFQTNRTIKRTFTKIFQSWKPHNYKRKTYDTIPKYKKVIDY